MKYDLSKLVGDVMGRMGEVRVAEGDFPFPTVEEAVRLKVRTLLPLVGKRLICSSKGVWGGDLLTSAPYSMTRMPCGLYAADIQLPEDFLRLLSVRMGEWRQGADRVILPGDADWTRQWSEEPGIAGCRDRPRVYLLHDGTRRLRCIGSASEDDKLASLSILQIPNPDEDGKFIFPEEIYLDLVEGILTSASY